MNQKSTVQWEYVNTLGKNFEKRRRRRRRAVGVGELGGGFMALIVIKLRKKVNWGQRLIA